MHKTKSDHARVCAIYHVKYDHARFGLLSRETLKKKKVKLTQSTALEQERCDPRSEAGVRSTP